MLFLLWFEWTWNANWQHMGHYLFSFIKCIWATSACPCMEMGRKPIMSAVERARNPCALCPKSVKLEWAPEWGQYVGSVCAGYFYYFCSVDRVPYFVYLPWSSKTCFSKTIEIWLVLNLLLLSVLVFKRRGWTRILPYNSFEIC